jgi:hypothetical protein
MSTATPSTKHQQIIEDRYIDRQRLEDYLKISFPKAEVKTQVSSSAQPSLVDVFKSSHMQWKLNRWIITGAPKDLEPVCTATNPS